MDKTIFPAWERAIPWKKALFEAWERQIAEMAGPGTAFTCVPAYFNHCIQHRTLAHLNILHLPIGVTFYLCVCVCLSVCLSVCVQNEFFGGVECDLQQLFRFCS